MDLNSGRPTKIFSLPFHIGLDEAEINGQFIPFVKKYKDYLYDIYFTCSITPFETDAMGITCEEGYSEELLDFMLWLQKRYGVRVTATFNNFMVPPSHENLLLFVDNLRPLYEKGLRSITIPHTHWARYGLLKSEFPDLFVKNTVLRGLSSAQEYAQAAESGFDLINVDCSLMRNRDALIELGHAYEKYKIPIAILGNEVCKGSCPLKEEHYQLNCSGASEIPYFSQEISTISCSKWRKEDKAFDLKIADLPPYRHQLDEILAYVQVIKLQGRLRRESFMESMEMIRLYAEGAEVMNTKRMESLNHLIPKEKHSEWFERTNNCKFNCWKCSYCEGIMNESTRERSMV